MIGRAPACGSQGLTRVTALMSHPGRKEGAYLSIGNRRPLPARVFMTSHCGHNAVGAHQATI